MRGVEFFFHLYILLYPVVNPHCQFEQYKELFGRNCKQAYLWSVALKIYVHVGTMYMYMYTCTNVT